MGWAALLDGRGDSRGNNFMSFYCLVGGRVDLGDEYDRIIGRCVTV